MPQQLPAWQIFKHSYALVWQKRMFLIAVAWPYLLVSWLSQLLANTLPLDGWDWLFSLGTGALCVLLLCIAAIYWHRNILLEERRAPVVPIQYNDIVSRYLLRAIQISVLCAVVLIALSLLWTSFFLIPSAIAIETQEKEVLPIGLLLFLTTTIGGLIIFQISFRLGLVLPATAIGEQHYGLTTCWKATRPHNYELFKINLLNLSVVSLLPTANLLFPEMQGVAKIIHDTLLYISAEAITIVSTFAGIGQLTLVFAFLTEKDDEPVVGPDPHDDQTPRP